MMVRLMIPLIQSDKLKLCLDIRRNIEIGILIQIGIIILTIAKVTDSKLMMMLNMLLNKIRVCQHNTGGNILQRIRALMEWIQSQKKDRTKTQTKRKKEKIKESQKKSEIKKSLRNSKRTEVRNQKKNNQNLMMDNQKNKRLKLLSTKREVLQKLHQQNQVRVLLILQVKALFHQSFKV